LDRRRAIKALAGTVAASAIVGCQPLADLGKTQDANSDATLAVLIRSMFEAEQALVYVIYKRELSREAWQKVFDRAVERVQAGWDLWDEGLWLEHPETNSRSLGPMGKHLKEV